MSVIGTPRPNCLAAGGTAERDQPSGAATTGTDDRCYSWAVTLLSLLARCTESRWRLYTARARSRKHRLGETTPETRPLRRSFLFRTVAIFTHRQEGSCRYETEMSVTLPDPRPDGTLSHHYLNRWSQNGVHFLPRKSPGVRGGFGMTMAPCGGSFRWLWDLWSTSGCPRGDARGWGSETFRRLPRRFICGWLHPFRVPSKATLSMTTTARPRFVPGADWIRPTLR